MRDAFYSFYSFFFFFTDTATTEIYTLSLHDALPISSNPSSAWRSGITLRKLQQASVSIDQRPPSGSIPTRSEEHTSELQSHHDLVCRLLLEKKKKNKKHNQPS